jgi:hypothetical protein
MRSRTAASAFTSARDSILGEWEAKVVAKREETQNEPMLWSRRASRAIAEEPYTVRSSSSACRCSWPPSSRLHTLRPADHKNDPVGIAETPLASSCCQVGGHPANGRHRCPFRGRVFAEFGALRSGERGPYRPLHVGQEQADAARLGAVWYASSELGYGELHGMSFPTDHRASASDRVKSFSF